MILRCQQCGSDFPAARSHAKFCSDRCRVRHSRGKNDLDDIKLRMHPDKLSRIEEVVEKYSRCDVCDMTYEPGMKVLASSCSECSRYRKLMVDEIKDILDEEESGGGCDYGVPSDKRELVEPPLEFFDPKYNEAWDAGREYERQVRKGKDTPSSKERCVEFNHSFPPELLKGLCYCGKQPFYREETDPFMRDKCTCTEVDDCPSIGETDMTGAVMRDPDCPQHQEKCERCGWKISSDFKYCQGCGRKLSRPTPLKR